MKKFLIVFATFLLVMPVYALPFEDDLLENTCEQKTIDDGRNQLKNVSYNLEYFPDATDREGGPLEGYMFLKFTNLPDGFTAILSQDNDYGIYEATKEVDTVLLSGDVYTIKFYNNTCSSVIKSMKVKIPSYKKHCDSDKDCNKDPWFDGTYENKTVIDKKEERVRANKILIVVLILLVLIIAGFIFIIIKRRKDHEKVI